KLSCDIIEFCAEHARKFNPISISGYHIREAGSTAAQELAFTVYNGITYVEECLRRGMDVDSFAPRLSFFWDVHSDFFEEIAKFRAARRLWANIVKTRFGAKNPHSLRLRAHAQTAGVSLTAQQPLNNVARVAIQALAAVLGGTQSLHTNSMDETLALPTEAAVKVALRTQQIIAEETGVANTIDPLAGSYFVEYMTDAIEKEAINYINHLDAMGGMLKAIEDGFPQKEIAEAAYAFLRRVENEEQIIVGVNAYTDDDEIGIGEIDILEIDKSVEAEQVRRTLEFKNERDSLEVQTRLDALKKACEENLNTMKPMIEAVDMGVTLGEVCDVFREVYGVYTDPGFS
ncbi:MAG: methylmalonyl-CoA mutase, partial [Deltaproteobacteria bacterium]|nr:methylmalonyl-CoA mutase [Deltaproteobacteria bacterium]